MESKFLTFSRVDIKGRKTPIFIVRNKNNSVLLGQINFYPQWRKYVFEPTDDVIFDTSCLKDILSFMEEQQKEWKENLINEKEN